MNKRSISVFIAIIICLVGSAVLNAQDDAASKETPPWMEGINMPPRPDYLSPTLPLKIYLENGELDVKLLGQGYAWFDAGTADSLIEAANFVKALERHQGIRLAAPEEIAFGAGWVGKKRE